ncbi:uncharacterized protein [Triticum aestivum]|uniref:uncharacterized protein n=1 Tax=Triticum aestivum TaxID=4565 RepID=UPI001D0089AD|nr:uncharacterized protein LOC123191386 [Triticum aestivum]
MDGQRRDDDVAHSLVASGMLTNLPRECRHAAITSPAGFPRKNVHATLFCNELFDGRILASIIFKLGFSATKISNPKTHPARCRRSDSRSRGGGRRDRRSPIGVVAAASSSSAQLERTVRTGQFRPLRCSDLLLDSLSGSRRRPLASAARSAAATLHPTSPRARNYDASRRFEFSKENFAGCTGVEFMIGAFACGIALLFRHYMTPPYEKESRYNTASCETKSTSDTCQHGQHGLEKME